MSWLLCQYAGLSKNVGGHLAAVRRLNQSFYECSKLKPNTGRQLAAAIRLYQTTLTCVMLQEENTRSVDNTMVISRNKGIAFFLSMLAASVAAVHDVPLKGLDLAVLICFVRTHQTLKIQENSTGSVFSQADKVLVPALSESTTQSRWVGSIRISK